MKRKIMFCRAVMVLLFFNIYPAFHAGSISIETILGKGLKSNSYRFENELAIEGDVKLFKTVAFGIENLFGKEDLSSSDYTDEITLWINYEVLDYLSIGISHKFFLSSGNTDYGLDFSFILAKEFKDIALVIENENEFLCNYSSKCWEYANTLGIEKVFPSDKKLKMVLFMENEFVIPLESGASGENALRFGPGITYDYLQFQIRYAIEISAEITQSAETVLTVSF